mgnify:CR=1 FL=1|tara:strand:+ start:85660 stop:85899 length:240 start_codon:yes stop_codon:yes gene_type:complete
MIGKIIGGFAGAKLAEKTSNLGGTGGALLGAAAVGVARRLSLPALLALGAGGYAYKKYSERKEKTPEEKAREKVAAAAV